MTNLRSNCHWVTAIAAALLVSIVQPPTRTAAGTYTVFDVPGSTRTYCSDVSGANVVGGYSDSAGVRHGYLYDGSTYRTLDPTGSTSTSTRSVFGNRVAGSYTDSAGKWHGFLYDGAGYRTLEVGNLGTQAVGVSADKVVGYYQGTGADQYHGFVYDGSTYTTLDPPGSTSTTVRIWPEITSRFQPDSGMAR
jgi:hypothetical protein